MTNVITRAKTLNQCNHTPNVLYFDASAQKKMKSILANKITYIILLNTPMISDKVENLLEKLRKEYQEHYCAYDNEDGKILKKIKNDPLKYTINDKEIMATNNPHWIWHDVGKFYAQYNPDGTIYKQCQCQGCSWHFRNLNCKPRIDNKHCLYCTCQSCVCVARVETNYYITPIDPKQLAKCGGKDKDCTYKCQVCKKHSQLFSNEQICIIILIIAIVFYYLMC
ncbi:MAG: hypothetical protein Edafosvirus1_9 [Edafosvirus sp.]|uniref:Uncharacterized protein n=1 Tax=Edafosvirus sp. TaxID=2487765 RepID=A0A3G4ZS10_9VIRU|nr:MAG: hypothetical protein Edafosvirus1_9 [Edafosvirus sp.]